MATSSPPSDLDYRPSYLAAAVVSVVILALYVVTLAPSTAMWDTSEYITAAYTLGLPHPPGNPLFVLIGRVFAILPIAKSVAMRINVLAAVCSAVSAGMWFLITERVLVSWFSQRWQRILGGSLAALIGATSFTVWNQSVVNEKVYTVSLMGIAIISWLMIRWCDEPDGRKADRILVLVAYLCGLGYANHMAGMLAAPAVGLAVLIVKYRTLLRWRLLLACFGALLLGITPFAMQPIRAAHFPALNEGEPTACREGLKVSCTLSAGTYDAFMYNFNRGQYGKPELTERQAPFTAQLGMWWLYFRWQWLRDAHYDHPFAQSGLAALFLVLGLLGGYVHYQLLLSLELLRLGRVGCARPRGRVGFSRRAHRTRDGNRGSRDVRAPDQLRTTCGVAHPGTRPHSALYQLDHGVARRTDRHRGLRARSAQFRRALRRPRHRGRQ